MKLEPGPELDRLIAEKVMGWKVLNVSGPGDSFSWNNWVDENERGMYATNAFTPSTDMNQALEVLETIDQDHDEISLETQPPGACHPWLVIIIRRAPTIFASADTLPHAICLAALETVGIFATQGESKVKGYVG